MEVSVMVFRIRQSALVASLLVFVSSGSGFPRSSAAPKDNSKDNQQAVLLKGIFYSRNSQFDEAEKELGLYRRLEPQDPVGCLEYANNEYFRMVAEKGLYVPELSVDKYHSFVYLLDGCLAESDRKIAEGGDASGLYGFVKACLYSLKAIVQFKNDSLKSAVDTASIMLSMASSSKYQCAGWLLGTTNYELSFLSWYYKPFLSVIGFPHNQQEGIALLRTAAVGNETIFADDIWFAVFHALSDGRLNNSERKRYEEVFGISRDALLAKLSAKYPHNFTLRKYAAKNEP